jgi:hypothetical protein
MAIDDTNPLAKLARSIANSPIPSLISPQVNFPKLELQTNPNLASEFYKKIVKHIQDFDDSLDDAFEVGIRLVSFGQTVVFHVEELGYWNPSLIIFYGKTNEDEPVELIQHVSQISILLIKLPRKNPDKPKIGFRAQAIAEPKAEP